MASDLDTSSSPLQGASADPATVASAPQRGWLKMGVVAAASALAGGIAAAWFYRNTLAQLRQAQSDGHDPEIRSSESGFEEDF